MTQSGKVLTVVVVAALGIWGCAQGTNGESAEQIKRLENDCKVLKEDYRNVAGARDRLRQQVAEMENDKAQLQKDLETQQALVKEHQALVKERDELVQQIGARTTERDAVQGQLEQVRKGLRNLLGQTEAAIGTTPSPAVSTSTNLSVPRS